MYLSIVEFVGKLFSVNSFSEYKPRHKKEEKKKKTKKKRKRMRNRKC